jgi:iron complex outermembrane receptor protein
MRVTSAVRLALLVSAAWPAAALAQANTGATSVDEVTVTAERAVTATKTDTPIVEIPQAISVVGEALFQDRGALNLQETLRYSAGVTAEAFGLDTRADTTMIRGLNPVQFLDGMRTSWTFAPLARNAVEGLDRVEVLRGPSSVLYGQASNGGIINSVSKTPRFTAGGSVRAEYGSYDRKQVMADVTGPLGGSGALAGRIVGVLRDAGQQTRELSDDRVFLSPSLTWRPGPDTEITAIGVYQKDSSGSSQQFLPLPSTILAQSDDRRISNRTFLGDEDYDTLKQRQTSLTVIAQHRLSDVFSVSARGRYTDAASTFQEIYPDVYSDPLNPFIDGTAQTGRVVNRSAYQTKPKVEIFSSDVNGLAKFDTGPFSHQLLVGVDYSDYRERTRSGFGAVTPIDVYNPVSSGVVAPAYDDLPKQRNSQLGLYVQDQIRYADRVSLVLGARRDRARSKTEDSDAQVDKAWTYKAGLIGEIGAGVSAYASYSEAFLPLAGLDINGVAFVPTRGRQYEGGLKWQPQRGMLFTATYFDIVESNRPTNDPLDVLNTVQTGEITSKGFELEAALALPRDIELTAAYSLTDAEVTESNFAPEVGVRLSDVPKHLASAWGVKTFTLDNDMALRLGAGVRYVGPTVSTGSALTLRTPSYTLVDALAQVSWDRWSLSLNVTNLFDEDYYAPCRAFGDCFTGNGRYAVGSLAYRF